MRSHSPPFQVWQYTDTDENNIHNILAIKEQRKLGTIRGKSTIPQAPGIHVRVKGAGMGPLRAKVFLWDFGPCQQSNANKTYVPPDHDHGGSQLEELRPQVYIDIEDEVADFSENQDSEGYRNAVLKCAVTRGARIMCRRRHIAFKIVLFAGEQIHPRFNYIRTSRLAISEKAMCPRDGAKPKKTSASKTSEPGASKKKKSEKLRKRTKKQGDLLKTAKDYKQGKSNVAYQAAAAYIQPNPSQNANSNFANVQQYGFQLSPTPSGGYPTSAQVNNFQVSSAQVNNFQVSSAQAPPSFQVSPQQQYTNIPPQQQFSQGSQAQQHYTGPPPNQQAFNPSQSNPQSFNPSQSNPQPFNPSQSNPQPFNPSQSNPQPFNPSQSNPQPFNPSQSNPQPFNPSQSNPQPFNPSQSNPQPFNPSQSNPQQQYQVSPQQFQQFNQQQAYLQTQRNSLMIPHPSLTTDDNSEYNPNSQMLDQGYRSSFAMSNTADAMGQQGAHLSETRLSLGSNLMYRQSFLDDFPHPYTTNSSLTGARIDSRRPSSMFLHPVQTSPAPPGAMESLIQAITHQQAPNQPANKTSPVNSPLLHISSSSFSPTPSTPSQE